jgi:hypothetical protein
MITIVFPLVTCRCPFMREADHGMREADHGMREADHGRDGTEV